MDHQGLRRGALFLLPRLSGALELETEDPEGKAPGLETVRTRRN